MNVTLNPTECALSLLAQATGQSPEAGSAVAVQSVWDFAVKGGPVMIPIGLCSLVALTVIIERVASLRRSKIIPAEFMPGLKAILQDVEEDRDKALAYCEKDASPMARIAEAGIRKLGRSVEVVEKYVQDAGEREVIKLRKHMRLLSVIASISTLLGLLGTITGMITAFQTVAASAEAMGKTELLAKGIYEAMITTAAGLMVAIPVVLAYQWLLSRIEHFVGEMDRTAVEFIEEFAETDRGVDGPRVESARIPFEAAVGG